jgi:hypothetical protein
MFLLLPMDGELLVSAKLDENSLRGCKHCFFAAGRGRSPTSSSSSSDSDSRPDSFFALLRIPH